MDTLVGTGTACQIGRTHGEQLAEAVGLTLRSWHRMVVSGWSWEEVLARTLTDERRLLAESHQEEITASRRLLAALIGYAFEQGCIQAKPTVDALFAENTRNATPACP